MGVSEPLFGILCVLAGSVLFGTSGTAQAFAPPGFDPLVIGSLRLLIGGAALFALSARNGELGHGRDWNWRKVLAASCCIAGFQLFFFTGVRLTGVAVGTMVASGSAPVLGGLVGRCFFREKLGHPWYFATVLAVAGCVLLCSGGDAMQAHLPGIALALGAGLSYATYSFLLKDMLAHHPPNAVAGVAAAGGAILLLPILTRLDPGWLLQWRSVAVVLYLGLATLAAPYWFLIRGLHRLPATTVVTLGLAEPATAALLGILLLGEELTFQSGLGILLVFAGLLALACAPHYAHDARERTR